MPHHPRPAITRHHAVHVTLRLAEDLGNVRRARTYHAFRRATMVAARKHDATIVHLSIQANHVHLLVEAADARQLGEGMRRFAISAARQLNRAVSLERGERRVGKVFTDRYHATVIKTPRQARNALSYVLNNWRRHGANHVYETRDWRFDPFSSAIHFRGWLEVPDAHVWTASPAYEPLVVGQAHSWILRVGWRRYGRIPLAERPGRTACPARRRSARAAAG